MLDDYLGFIHAGLGQLFLLLGALVAAALMRWASQYYQRVCRQPGTALAACGLTGQLVAQRLLAKCGLSEVAVVRSNRRNLYHPWKRQIQLNTMTFESPSLLALTTAAHEVGHAQQFASRILLCRLRTIFWPICYVLIGLAVILPFLQIAEVVHLSISNLGAFMLAIGVATVLLQLPIHLPLEYDASQRARKLVQEERLVGLGEQRSFDEMLKAAWFTHAAHQAQGCIYMVAVAVVIFLYPSFTGSPEVLAQDLQSSVSTSLEQALRIAPVEEPVEMLPEPEPMGELLTISPFFLLFSSALGLVPCLVVCLILAKFTSGARNKKPPAQRAIERNNAGLALNEKGAFQAAIREFDEALRLDPNLAAAYYNRGQIYYRLGRLDEALADFDANLRITPGYAYAIASRAEIWAQRGDFDRAMTEHDAALRLAPENSSLLTMRGFAKFRRSDAAGAQADFESALRYNPKELLAYQGRGMVWMSRAEPDKALADFNQALALGDHDATTYTLRGQTWLANNEHDRAIADFTEALRRDAKQAAAHRDRGLAWFFKNQFDRAIADLDNALRLSPADATAFNNRGAALLKTGEYARAVADLREAIRLAPSFPNPHKHLAWLQATCPQPEFRNGADAVANATRALELAEWKPTEWFSVLAAAYAEAGNFDEAVKWQTKCLEESPPQVRAESESRVRIYQAREPFRDQPGITQLKLKGHRR